MKFQTTARLKYELSEAATILASIKCMRTPGQSVVSESFTSSREVELMDMEHSLAQGTFTRINIATPGNLTLKYQAEVIPSYEVADGNSLADPHPYHLPAEVIPFTFPSRYCQSDQMRLAAEEIAGQGATSYQQVSNIVNWIHENVDYTPGVTVEQDSAPDILERRAGVCRDFSHLAIALLRALSIPARYITAYACGLSPQDFHACFEVYLGERWCLFDATRLAPLDGIIRIASGCDAADTALACLYGGIIGTAVEVNCTSMGGTPTLFQSLLLENQQAFVLG